MKGSVGAGLTPGPRESGAPARTRKDARRLQTRAEQSAARGAETFRPRQARPGGAVGSLGECGPGCLLLAGHGRGHTEAEASLGRGWGGGATVGPRAVSSPHAHQTHTNTGKDLPSTSAPQRWDGALGRLLGNVLEAN